MRVTLDSAMRARDVSRPRPENETAAMRPANQRGVPSADMAQQAGRHQRGAQMAGPRGGAQRETARPEGTQQPAGGQVTGGTEGTSGSRRPVGGRSHGGQSGRDQQTPGESPDSRRRAVPPRTPEPGGRRTRNGRPSGEDEQVTRGRPPAQGGSGAPQPATAAAQASSNKPRRKRRRRAR